MRLLVLDNYDSFTYNLVHLVEKVSDIPFDVIRNDALSVEEAGTYSKILLSPGPGLPSEAGIMPALLERYKQSHSILGVCLGMQAIAEASGCPLRNLSKVCHGQASPVTVVQEDLLFRDCPPSFLAGRYHSWVIDEARLNEELIVTALGPDQLIMAVKHQQYDLRGVQFHPESILSEYGETILRNWLCQSQ